MIEEKTKFPETVIIIDVEYLNYVLTDIKKHFTTILGRKLPDIELNKLITYVALDAAVPAGDKEIMVVLVHAHETKELVHCTPSVIKKELNNVAFRNNLGEFQISALSTEGLAAHEDLLINVLELVSDSSDTKKIIVVGFEDVCEIEFKKIIANKKYSKEFIQFAMKQPTDTTSHKWEFLAFPLMQAFGIRGDEIG